MFSFRDVVYNKATDDFTVSVKDLKRDIVMDGERLVIITPTPSQPRRRPPPLSPGSTTWWSPPATTRCPTCPPSPASRSSPAGFFMPTTSGFPHCNCLCLHRRSCCTSHIDIIFASVQRISIIQPPGMPQSLLESDFFWLAQATLQKTSLFNASSNPIDYNSDDLISFSVAHKLLKQRY